MDPDRSAAEAAYAEAEAINPAVNGVFHRTRDAMHAARAAGGFPAGEAARLKRAIGRLDRELAAATKLRPVDREEVEDTLIQAKAMAAVLARLTSQRACRVRSRAAQLIAAASDRALHKGDAEDAVLLAVLALPSGPEYWNLLRGARWALQAEGRRPWELWGAVRVLAPDDVFGDGPSYPGAPRGASRATRVTGVTAGGLPGLGKRP